jgi:molecular chaperone DnaJ
MNQDWAEKDFYQVLGVGKDATAAEVKKAYRKLAQKHHPDANPGDSKAEDEFKRISEAYSVLGDEEKRREYDEFRRLVATGGFGARGGFGGQGFGGQSFRVEDLGDLLGGAGLGDLFGFGSGRRGGGRGPQRGADTAATLHLPFEDAVNGVTTQVNVRGEATCSRCHGSGAEPGTSATTCPTCHGAGQIAQSQGMFAFPQTCPQCRGRGSLIDTPCTNCRGAGRQTRTRTINVKVPAGVRDGATIRLPGKGSPGSNGGPAGDLLVTVTVDRHPLFGRSKNDLTVTVPVTYAEAALGAKLDVPTLNGSVTLRIPPGTQPGKTFRVRGRGVQPARGKQGDLLVKIDVVVPTKLSRDERRLLEQLSEFDTEDLRAHLRT